MAANNSTQRRRDVQSLGLQVRQDIKLVWGPTWDATLLCITQPWHLSPALCQLSHRCSHHHRRPQPSVLALLAHTCLCKPFGCKGLPLWPASLAPFAPALLPCRLGCAMLLCRLCRPPVSCCHSRKPAQHERAQRSSSYLPVSEDWAGRAWPLRVLLPCSFSRMLIACLTCAMALT